MIPSLGLTYMGVGSGKKRAVHPLWIFKHGTNIVDRGLKVLFFGLFSLPPFPPENFLPTPLYTFY